MEKTAQTNLLLLEKKDFIETELYNDVLKDVFDTGRFSIKIPENQIEFLFDNKKEANNDFRQYDVEIEDLYVDLESSFIKSMVVSFYDKKGRLEYGLIVNYPYKRSYELMYTNSDYKKIKAKDAERCLFNQNIAKGIIKRLGGETLDSLLFLKYDIQFTSERLFYFSGNKASDEFFDLLELVLAKKFGVRTDFDYVLNTLIVDVQDVNKPILVYVEFTYEEKLYKYWIESDELNEISELDNGKDDVSFIDAFLDVAMQNFVDDKSNLILERQAQEVKNNAFNFFKTRYKKLKEIREDAFGFEELDGEPFIFFSDDSVSINTSRNNETTGAVTYFYDELEANATEIKRIIDRYFNTRSIKYDTFINDGNKYLESSYDLEEAIKVGSELLKRADTFCDADRSQKLFSSVLNKIEEKHSKFLNIDKEKVSKAIGLINKIKDPESYEKYCDDLNDAIDDLGEGELAAIKSQYDAFLNTFGTLSKYDSQTVYRSVFIRKSVLEQLKKIDDDEKDLNIIHILDEIVDKLKTTPGNQLGRYLLNKGLNFPIKADRSVKKIRIMRHAKYRLLFVYGSDLDLDERLYNCDSIFIFAVTKHDKNKKELYNLAETKPNKYRIGDFIIYSKDKYLNMPECTLDQYKIAAEIENHPIVTFGCAGSGKTTVSIEKYKNIVYNEYGCVSPAPDKLVYITFHKRLSERSKKELDEYKVNGNCCKLTDYFAYVLGDLEEKDAFCQNESDNKEKKELVVLTELTFIEWFRKEYSQEEIKNNKRGKKKRITPLLDKPDIERLIYTYYRGVFKGSKLLRESNLNYLTLEEFLKEMDEESYLTSEEKESIYQICKEFDEYASSNKLINDNDLALRVIRQANYKIRKTKCIIIDEVQDLTEIEIVAVIMTLNDDSMSIYFYGDPHQSINPNIFDGSTINKVYSDLGRTASSETAPLTITYRTNIHLISYLNELLKYRDKWIGLAKGGASEILQPPETQEDTSWAGYVTDKNIYSKIFDVASKNANSAIITPSEMEKNELLKKYPKVAHERVFTIYEAKGMEWDTVVMYDMFTSYKTYFYDMISENGNAKKSTIHRMTFNKYYVGCTRSRKSFVIIEEDQNLLTEGNEIFDTLLSSFAPIYKPEQVNTYILEDSSFDGWYREALQNLGNESEATFKHALMHAKEKAVTEEQKKLIAELINGNPDTLEQYGFNFLDSGQYDLARNAFIKCDKALGVKKHAQYVVLTSMLENKHLSEDRIRDLLKYPEVFDRCPAALPKLMKQETYQARLKRLYMRLFDKEN